MSKKNEGHWGSGRQNPSRLRAMAGVDDSADRIVKLRAEDAAFCAAMHKAPEAQDLPTRVSKTPGTDNPQPIGPPRDVPLRSSSGW